MKPVEKHFRKTKRLNIGVNEKMHIDLLKKSEEECITIQEYVVKLIAIDLYADKEIPRL